MLNFGDTGSMVFEPDFVIAQPGDTIKFVPTNTGHNVKSFAVPKGANPFTSKLNEIFEVKLEQQGVYLYYCPPHLMMGMVGMIQVGKAENLVEIKQKASRLDSKIVMNKERVEQVLKRVVYE